jgi:hypothetical protein
LKEGTGVVLSNRLPCRFTGSTGWVEGEVGLEEITLLSGVEKIIGFQALVVGGSALAKGTATIAARAKSGVHLK